MRAEQIRPVVIERRDGGGSKDLDVVHDAGSVHDTTDCSKSLFHQEVLSLLVGDQDDVKEDSDDGDERRADDTGEVRHVSPFVGLPPRANLGRLHRG